MSERVRQIDQDDWDQLITIAAGFLPLTNGDLTAAMSRAIAAHAELVENVRAGRVSADLPRGSVRLEHREGNLTLVYERHEPTDPGASERSMPLLGFPTDQRKRR